MRDQEIVDLMEAYSSIYSAQEELAEEVEIAAQYFYEMGLNEEGVEILIEELGVEEFSEWVYDIADDYYLTERKLGAGETALPASSRKRIGGRSAASRKFSDPTKKTTAGGKRRAARAAARAESESQETPRQARIRELRARAADKATKKQPKKQGLLDRVAGAVNRGLDAAKNKAQKDIETRKKFMSNVRGTVEVAKKAAGKVGGVAKEVGKGASGAVKFAAAVTREEVELWVNSLIEEGYDLSEYTWDDMYEIYMEEVKQLDENRMAAYTAGMSDGARASAGTQVGSRVADSMSRSNVKFFFGRRKQGGQAGYSPNPSSPATRNRTGRGTPVQYRGGPLEMPKGNSSFKNFSSTHKEEVDLFDYILEHLVAEGYAETPEAAEAIMVNMSEDWRDGILQQLDEISDRLARRARREREARYNKSVNQSINSASMYGSDWSTQERKVNRLNQSLQKRGIKPIPTN